MKAALFCFIGALLTLPGNAAPSTYSMTFTGGFYLNLNNPPTPFAPDSGTFTYDPNGGFQSFLVEYNSETFDLTASANAPLACDSSGQNCSTGTAATAFTALGENPTWSSFEGYSGSNIVTYLVLAPYEGSNLGVIYTTASGFSGFTPGQSDLVRSGTFTLAGSAPNPAPTPTPTPSPNPNPGSAVPEPAFGPILTLAGISLMGLHFKRR